MWAWTSSLSARMSSADSASRMTNIPSAARRAPPRPSGGQPPAPATPRALSGAACARPPPAALAPASKAAGAHGAWVGGAVPPPPPPPGAFPGPGAPPPLTGYQTARRAAGHPCPRTLALRRNRNLHYGKVFGPQDYPGGGEVVRRFGLPADAAAARKYVFPAPSI